MKRPPLASARGAVTLSPWQNEDGRDKAALLDTRARQAQHDRAQKRPDWGVMQKTRPGLTTT